MNERLSQLFQRTGQVAGLSLLLIFADYATAHGQGSAPATAPVQLPLSRRGSERVSAGQSVSIPGSGSTTVQIQVPGTYAGSVPTTERLPSRYPLGLLEAVQRGLVANLGTLGAGLSLQQSRAQYDQARSALLPNVSVNFSENAAKVNLAAEGFSASAFGGDIGFAFPTTVGPFHYYDAHAALHQDLFDLTAVRNLTAQGREAEAATLQVKQAREEVILAVAGTFLQLMADIALVERQKAEVSLADASYQQANAQAEAGNKAPIEANRSLVELRTEQQHLQAQMGQVRKRQIQLARLIGLPLSTEILPKELLRVSPSNLPDLQTALEHAWSQRQDLKALEAQLRAAEQARKAASSQRLPSASINGTYGLEGINPNAGSSVFQVTAALNIPVYMGGRISADVAQADAVLRQRRAEYADQRSAVEADVRNAYVDLQVTNDQVKLAESNRALASETLQQSQDRFAVGVADSVEVVSSQQALAAADHDFVNSLFAQHVARITLAHAMGEAEQRLPELLEKDAQ